MDGVLGEKTYQTGTNKLVYLVPIGGTPAPTYKPGAFLDELPWPILPHVTHLSVRSQNRWGLSEAVSISYTNTPTQPEGLRVWVSGDQTRTIGFYPLPLAFQVQRSTNAVHWSRLFTMIIHDPDAMPARLSWIEDGRGPPSQFWRMQLGGTGGD